MVGEANIYGEAVPAELTLVGVAMCRFSVRPELDNTKVISNRRE